MHEVISISDARNSLIYSVTRANFRIQTLFRRIWKLNFSYCSQHPQIMEISIFLPPSYYEVLQIHISNKGLMLQNGGGEGEKWTYFTEKFEAEVCSRAYFVQCIPKLSSAINSIYSVIN